MWANISIATSEKFKDEYLTTWHNIVGWGKTAENISRVQKGDKLYVNGKIQVREYEKEGVKKQSFEILAWEIIVASKQTEASTTLGTEPEFGHADDSELPF
jgi:single stranded DNA-binding protein